MDCYSPYSLYEIRDTHEKMRTDLHHLPKKKQQELGQVARALGEMEGGVVVILYGSYVHCGDNR